MTYPYYCIKSRSWKVRKSKLRSIGGLLLMGLALSIFFWTISPLVTYQINYANRLENLTMISPVIEEYALGSNSELLNINRWFDKQSPLSWEDNKALIGKEYLISIPSLGIENAKVIVGSDDLSHNLIHYPGTALPGELGTAVLFGHSVLPQFFNAENYKTIFSTLHTLKKNSEIFVSFDGMIYRYVVDDHFVVESDDFGVLSQSESNYWMKLITCTPPGTYLRRLVVKSHLDPYE